MTAREGGEVKGIQGIAVQENGSTVVSSADTVNIVGGGTVTDVGGVATINIPQGVEWYREDVPAGSASYTFVNEPATDTSFLIFTDSGTLLFSGIDYTYNTSTHTVTFLSLDTNEAAYIWVAHATVLGGGIGDMVKSVYDPTNINASAFDYNNFINKPVIGIGLLTLQKNGTQVAQFNANSTVNVTADITVPTTVAELSDASDYVTDSELATDLADVVEGPVSATDGNIAVFDGATGKLIKDSGLNIQVVNSQPTGLACTVFYDNGTIYLYTHQPSEILMENGNVITTEDGNPIILEN